MVDAAIVDGTTHLNTMTAAFLAHRYALSMKHVGTVVIGVKNRAELDECLAAEAAGPLPAALVRAVDECVPARA